MRTFIKIVQVLGVVAIVAGFAIFAFDNAQPVAVKFLQYRSAEQPVFIVILASFVLGLLVAGLLSLTEIVRLNARLRRQVKQTRAFEKQLHLIKQQPLMDDFKATAPQARLNPNSLPQQAGPDGRIETEDDEFADDDQHYYPHIR